MSQVQGVIEDILVESKSIQGEMKDIHYIVVGGKKYNNGFYPASYGKGQPAKVGDEVIFESEYKYKENKVDYKTFRRVGAAVAAAAVKAAPVDNGVRVRIAALEAAVKTPIDLPSAEGYITTAKAYESYLLGE